MIVCAMVEQNGDRAIDSGIGQSDLFLCMTNERGARPQKVFKFLRKAYRVAKWSPETNFIALVLATRIQHEGLCILWSNWNKLLFTALLVAQKMWDDVPLTNTDFPRLWTICAPEADEFALKELNKMEMEFLRILNWQTHVTREVYTQFYFELRALAMENRGEAGFQRKPQTDSQLCEVEVRSQTDGPPSIRHPTPSQRVLLKQKDREDCLTRPLSGQTSLRRLFNSRAIKVVS